MFEKCLSELSEFKTLLEGLLGLSGEESAQAMEETQV